MGKKKHEDPAELDAELDREVEKDIAAAEKQAADAMEMSVPKPGPEVDEEEPTTDYRPTHSTPPETPNALAASFPSLEARKLALIVGHLREVEARARSGADIDVLRFVRQLLAIAEG